MGQAFFVWGCAVAVEGVLAVKKMHRMRSIGVEYQPFDKSLRRPTGIRKSRDPSHSRVFLIPNYP